jgi:hypothetical protein
MRLPTVKQKPKLMLTVKGLQTRLVILRLKLKATLIGLQMRLRMEIQKR